MPFAQAWTESIARVVWPHDTVHRRQWREALRATRAEWEASYEGRETRTSARMRDFRPEVVFAEDAKRGDALAA